MRAWTLLLFFLGVCKDAPICLAGEESNDDSDTTAHGEESLQQRDSINDDSPDGETTVFPVSAKLLAEVCKDKFNPLCYRLPVKAPASSMKVPPPDNQSDGGEEFRKLDEVIDDDDREEASVSIENSDSKDKAEAALSKMAGSIDSETSDIDTDAEGPRRLQDDTTIPPSTPLQRQFRPIRIFADTSQLSSAIGSQLTSYIKDDLVPAALAFLEQRIDVARREEKNLRVPRTCGAVLASSDGQGDFTCHQFAPGYDLCGEATIPQEYFEDSRLCAPSRCHVVAGGNGVPNADLILMITAGGDVECQSDSTTLVLASSIDCVLDSNDRPVVGNVHLCPEAFAGGTASSSNASFNDDVATIVHEVIHVLGMSYASFAWYRDHDGNPRTPRDRYGQPGFNLSHPFRFVPSEAVARLEERDGILNALLRTPQVVYHAREFFKCNALDGVPLENEGGSGTRFNHWEKSKLGEEMMQPSSGRFLVVSNITLGLIQDTGYYISDFTMGMSMNWGNGELLQQSLSSFVEADWGCDFLNKACLRKNITDALTARTSLSPFCIPEVFTDEESTRRWVYQCDLRRYGVADCATRTAEDPHPLGFQYFEDPRIGGDTTGVDQCTVKYSTRTESCTSPKDAAAQKAVYGGTVGPTSRCVYSKLRVSAPSQEAYDFARIPLEGQCFPRKCLTESSQVDRFGDAIVTGVNITVAYGNGETLDIHCRKDEAGIEKSAPGPGVLGSLLCPDVDIICQNFPCAPGATRSRGRCICPPGMMGLLCDKTDTAVNRKNHPRRFFYPHKRISLWAGNFYNILPHIEGSAYVRYYLIDGSDIPEGLTLDTKTGAISGTPSKATSDCRTIGIKALRENPGESFPTEELRPGATTAVSIQVIDKASDVPTSVEHPCATFLGSMPAEATKETAAAIIHPLSRLVGGSAILLPLILRLLT